MGRPIASVIRPASLSLTAARTATPTRCLKVYDETLRVLKSAVQKAKLGREEELQALQRLDEQARRLERKARGPSVDAFIEEERRQSHAYGGRSVFGDEPPGALSDAEVYLAAWGKRQQTR